MGDMDEKVDYHDLCPHPQIIIRDNKLKPGRYFENLSEPSSLEKEPQKSTTSPFQIAQQILTRDTSFST